MNPICTHRVLVIDDQAAIHEDYRKILGKQATASTAALDKAAAQLFGEAPEILIDWEGFDLDSAFQGQEGLELVERAVAERRPYAMAFVDIRMPPGWDGVETVRRIWEIDPEVLVVLCSAYSDYSWQDMVRELGRNDRYLILRKPFDNIEVRQCAMALTERWNQSRTDVLTGLLNRRAFRSYLDLEWRQWALHKDSLSCAMFDLDYFKRVNDSLGHQAGDVILKQLAQVLLTRCRASDSICRYGGDEICVLLPHTGEQEAAAWAESVRLDIESMPIMLGDRRLDVTTSIGVAERSPDDDDPEQLIDRADQALIGAKAAGRNCVVADSAATQAGPRVGDRWAGISLREVMSSPVIALKWSATAGEAAQFLAQGPVVSAPVVDADGKMIGVVSEQDLLAVVGNEAWWQLSIERIMCREIDHHREDTPVQSVVACLARAAVHRVFVVRDGRPIGAVSRRNLLGFCLRGAGIHGDGKLTAALCLGGEVDRTRLAQHARRMAELAAKVPAMPVFQASDSAQTMPTEIVGLPTLLDDSWAYLLSGEMLPIVGQGPDFSGFGAPNAPLTPLG